MAEPKFTYGLDENGTLIHGDEAMRGKGCNCVCPDPQCKAKLVAKQGAKNKWHFAHDNGADCIGGRMTALHKLAQQIIQEEKKIRTPRYEDFYYKQEPEIITFDEVLVEQHIEILNRQPDCVGVLNGESLWIEIKVTHEVDEAKQRDIAKENISCMEVDLSDLIDVDYTKDMVRKRLFLPNEYRYSRWINNPELQKKSREESKKRKEKENKENESSRKIQEYIDAEHQKEAVLKHSQKMKEKPQDDFADEYSTPTYDEWIKFCQSFDK